jgi:hypothetical protein
MQTTRPYLFTRPAGDDTAVWCLLGPADRVLAERLTDLYAPDDIAQFEIRHMTGAEAAAVPKFKGRWHPLADE